MNQSKVYILPDGEEIDLSQIKNIGDLKSVRSKSFTSLGYCTFTIKFKDGTLIEISEGYFFYDWIKSKLKLQKIRDEIIQHFNDLKSK